MARGDRADTLQALPARSGEVIDFAGPEAIA